jgi:hypothetical protein
MGQTLDGKSTTSVIKRPQSGKRSQVGKTDLQKVEIANEEGKVSFRNLPIG